MYKTTGNGNGKLYCGTVKWDDNFNSGNYSAMLFSNEADRNSFFKTNLNIIKDNVIFINPEKYVDIDTKLQGVENWNYCYYINDSDISTTEYCCFITNFEYIAPNTTRLYLSPDYFQMLFYKTTFYRSYVERATVKRSTDTVGKYLQGEPFSISLQFETKIKDILTVANWEPQWVLHSCSKYNPQTEEYEYGGTGTDNTFGEYGFYIDTKQNVVDILENYGRKSFENIMKDFDISVDWGALFAQLIGGGVGITGQEGIALDFGTSLAELQDHRNELIGLYAIPSWCRHSNQSSEATNKRVSATETVSLNSSTLGNTYTPRNKKLLTSICRAYVILNENGLQIALKPELFNANSTTITLSGIPMSTSGYQYEISNYDDYGARFGEVPYSSERRVGYDQNTGLTRVINNIGAVSNITGSISSAIGNVVSGATSGGAVGGIVGGVGAIGSITQSGISAIDQIGNQGAYFGNNGDLLRITGGKSQLKFYELNPSYRECEAIDDFFDVYGYTINEIYNINDSTKPIYIRSRKYWNFIKIKTLNAKCNAPTKWERAFKSIFESGITLWHDYANFGNYDNNNIDA